MIEDQTQRPAFFEEQYLGAADLNAGVDYTRIQLGRHALGAHTWGIAFGLELIEKAAAGGGSVDVYLEPGWAWDGFGRPVTVLQSGKLPPELFQDLTFDSVLDSGNPAGRLVEVWLRYNEIPAQPPAAGFETCNTGSSFARVAESFRLEIGPRLTHAQLHDPITVANFSGDALGTLQALNPQTPPVSLFDESVPVQQFPDNPRARWLIPLGVVRWLPNTNPTQPGHFVARVAADLTKSAGMRRYLGVVAGAVQAAGKNIRLRSRTVDYSPVSSDELVWVEGDLRISGNARLFAGALDFRDANGMDPNVPLSLQRAGNTSGGLDLQAVIGKAAAGANTFKVGPLDGSGNFTGVLTVRDDGKVGIGTAAPALTLDVKGDLGRTDGASTLHLWGSTVGDVGAGVLFLRSGGGVAAFDDPNIRVGVGTNAPIASLQINGDLVLQKKAGGGPRTLPAEATMLWNDGTWLRLNQNLDFSMPVFGVHTPGLLAPGSLNVGGAGGWGDPGPGNVWITGSVGIGTTTPALKLDVQGDLGRTNGAATLHLFGSTIGDVGAGVLFLRSGGGVVAFDDAADSVGIGTTTPSAKLEVVGDLTLSGSGVARKPGGGTWTAPSDARLKQNVRPLVDALETLLRLRGVSFEWREPASMGGLDGRQMGLIAQEVEPVLPAWVGTSPEGYKELTLRGFEALVIEALRELAARTTALAAALPAAQTS